MNLDVESKGKSIALKTEHLSCNATPYSEEEVMMLTRDLGEFLRRTGKAFKPQGRLELITGIGKAKLDEIIFARRPTRLKSGLGYTSTNPNHTAGTRDTQRDSCYTTFWRLEGVLVKDSLSRAEKRNLFKKHKPRRPPLMCDYCKMFGHRLAEHGHGKEALYVFNKLLLEGLIPDGFSILSVTCACSHVGLVEQGWRYFDTMQSDYGIELQLEHYGCLIDLLGRARRVKEAEKII
ncbi:hypothetical protein M9H77_08314 [Catharanthus roseus]|uniref:Uncharacterized protein n=1 Tax=Catharanthus roseus TaxID=4058 RepID=A0ACC0BXL5_CATRO|nr:hypothetical protein M9H77_08314 [Catharanthus roseus]